MKITSLTAKIIPAGIVLFFQNLKWFLTDNGSYMSDERASVEGGRHTHLEIFRRPGRKHFEIGSPHNWALVDSRYKQVLREQITALGFTLRED